MLEKKAAPTSSILASFSISITLSTSCFGKTAYNFVISSFSLSVLFSAREYPADKACPPTSSIKPAGRLFIKSTRFIAPLLRQEPFILSPPLPQRKTGQLYFSSARLAVKPKTPGLQLASPVIITSGQELPISESIILMILSTASFLSPFIVSSLSPIQFASCSDWVVRRLKLTVA